MIWTSHVFAYKVLDMSGDKTCHAKGYKLTSSIYFYILYTYM